jgi:Prenyltransferase and squalene oxidase repeat
VNRSPSGQLKTAGGAEGPTSLAERLATTIGGAATRLRIRAEPVTVATEVFDLIREPVELYEAHPNWPSRLTDSGLPVELSLKIGAAGEPSIRCAVDVTDHRRGLADNWSRYVRYACLVAGGDEDWRQDDLWDLCQLHLTGIPAGFPSRMMHGLGYGTPDWRRASLYFHTGWLRPEQIMRRLPRESAIIREVEERRGCRLDLRLQVVGYDLVAGEALRLKVYKWLRVEPRTDLGAVVGLHSDLAPARRLFEAFRARARPHLHPRPLLHQLGLRNGHALQRLFFICPAWGWNTTRGRAALLRFLGEDLNLDLSSLSLFCEVAAANQIRLTLAMVAVGADPLAASVTFYLWPLPRRAHSPVVRPRSKQHSPKPPSGIPLMTPERPRRRPLLRQAQKMLDQAMSYLLAMRSPEGYWSDYDTNPGPDESGGDRTKMNSHTHVTAYVASALMANEATDQDLATTYDWLLRQHQPSRGWGWDDQRGVDSETTALALLALARSGRTLPRDAHEALLPARLPDASYRRYSEWDADVHDGSGSAEITAISLLALLVTCPGRIDWVVPTTLNVLNQQRRDGGWSSVWWKDDLAAIWWAVQCLRAFGATYGGVQPAGTAVGPESGLAVQGAIRRALRFLSSHPVPREPLALGLWLGSWCVVGGDISYPSVSRALAALRELQQPAGRWLGSPNRRIKPNGLPGLPVRLEPEQLWVDGRCLVTTATVAGALQSFLEAV